MAIAQLPLVGSMKGQVGGLVFSKSKGKNIVRSKPVSVANNPTARQVAQRAAMSLVTTLGRFLTGITQIGFREKKATANPANLFTGYALRYAFDFDSAPDITFDPEMLEIANGSMGNTVVTATWDSEDRVIGLTWPTTLGLAQSATDQLYVAVVLPDGSAAFSFPAVAARSAGSYDIDVLGMGTGSMRFVVYAFFASTVSSMVSDSFMAGTIAVTAT